MFSKEPGAIWPSLCLRRGSFGFGAGQDPALQSFVDLAANPNLGALRAFGEIKQVGVVKAGCVAPLACITLIGAG